MSRITRVKDVRGIATRVVGFILRFQSSEITIDIDFVRENKVSGWWIEAEICCSLRWNGTNKLWLPGDTKVRINV